MPPPLSDDTALKLTRRYQDLLELGTKRAQPTLDQAWAALDTYDEARIAEFLDSITPMMTAVKNSAVNVTSGYLSAVTGLPPTGVATELVESAFDEREPFIATWRALNAGRPYDEAVEAGRLRLESMVRTYMAQTARQTGDHYVRATGHRATRWKRVPDAGACAWCRSKARDDFKSSEAANFGHHNCMCTVLPVVEDFDPTPISATANREAAQVTATAEEGPAVVRPKTAPLTDAQYAALKPGRWDIPTAKKIRAQLKSTPDGRMLEQTLTRFQSGSSRGIPAFRTNIEKRLTGQPLEPGAAKRVDNMLDAIRQSPHEPPTLFRGMRLDGTADQIVARYSEPTVDLNLSSFTSDKKRAAGFAADPAGQKAVRTKTQTPVIIELAGGKSVKALPIEKISLDSLYAGEKEWLTGGRFAVDSVTKAKDGTVVLRVRQLVALGE